MKRSLSRTILSVMKQNRAERYVALCVLAVLMVAEVAEASPDARQEVLKLEEKRQLVLAKTDLCWDISGHGVVGTANGVLKLPPSNIKGAPTELHEKTKGFKFHFKTTCDIVRGRNFDVADVGYPALDMNNSTVNLCRNSMYFAPGLQAVGVQFQDDKGKETERLDSIDVVSVTGATALQSMAQNCCLSSTIDFRPETAIFIAGASPLELYGLSPSTVVQTANGYVIRYNISGVNPSNDTTLRQPFHADIVLAHDGTPTSLIYMMSKANWIKITAIESTIDPILPLATQFIIDYSGFSTRLITYRLSKRVRKATPTDKHAVQVTDWRLLKSNMGPSDFPPRGVPKDYVWAGWFPSLKDLAKEPDIIWGVPDVGQPPKSSSGMAWFLIISGSMVAGGTGLYIILRARSFRSKPDFTKSV